MRKAILVSAAILLISVVVVGPVAAQDVPPLPFRIGGTVTIEGTPLTPSTDEGLVVKVTKKDGEEYRDLNDKPPLDEDGVNASGFYLINVPSYHSEVQPGGAQPGDTGVVHVFMGARQYQVATPTKGEFLVGSPAAKQRLDLVAALNPTPSLRVEAPGTSDQWNVGDAYLVRWSYQGDPGKWVKIDLLQGTTGETALASMVPLSSGSWPWLLSSDLPAGSDYRIRVTSQDNPACTDTGSTFTVLVKAKTLLTLTSPNGQEQWPAGSTQTLAWTYTGEVCSFIKISLFKNGLFQRTIAGKASVGSGGNGSYAWKIPAAQAPGDTYRVQIQSVSNSACSDLSDSNFAITTPPKITVSSPNGGEDWPAGTTQTIRWTFTGNPGTTAKVELLKGGKPVRTIAESASVGTAGSGSLEWPIPTTLAPGKTYRVRVASTTTGTCEDTSDKNFTISSVPAPCLTVTSPNGPEEWTAGSTRQITWSFSGDPGDMVKMDLLKSNEVNRTIAESTAIGTGGTGSFAWTVPSDLTPGKLYKVRVLSLSNSTCQDTSNDNFTVAAAPTLTVEVPNGGESWPVGTTQTIRWNYTGDPCQTVTIETLKGGVMQTQIALSAPIGSGGTGSLDWAVPGDYPPGTDYRIRVSCNLPGSCQDTGDAAFSIAAAQQLPNLTPVKPPDWDDKIVLSYLPNTHTDDRPIWSVDTVYLDWAVANAGSADVSGDFRFDLYVDGMLAKTWEVTFSSWPTAFYTHIDDFPLESLTAGPHTVRLVIDPENQVLESDETDNEYEKTFTVMEETW